MKSIRDNRKELQAKLLRVARWEGVGSAGEDEISFDEFDDEVMDDEEVVFD